VPKSLRKVVLAGGGDDGDPLGCGLEAVARFTRVDVDARVLGGGTVFEVEPPPMDLVVYSGDEPWLSDHRLHAAIRALSAGGQRRVAVWAATAAVREASLEEDPVVRDAFARTTAGQGEGPIDLPPSAARAYATRTAAARRFFEYEELLSWGERDLPDRGYHTASATGPLGGSTSISHLEGQYLRQGARALDALRHLAHPDPLSAAVASVEALIAAVAAGRTERGALFREDDTGRHRAGTRPDQRYERLRAALSDLAASLERGADLETALAQASAGLPVPLTEEQRRGAIHADALAAAQGAFAEYQVVRDRDDLDSR